MDAAVTRIGGINDNIGLSSSTLSVYYILPNGGGAEFECKATIAILGLLGKSAVASAINSDASARGFSINGVIFPDMSYVAV